MSEPLLPDPRRAYMKDALDVLAYHLYLGDPGFRGVAGFHPPERPDGWLDDAEAAAWERWRQRAASEATP